MAYINQSDALAVLNGIIRLYQCTYTSKVRAEVSQFCKKKVAEIPAADVAPVRHSEILDRRKVEVDGEWECARCGWQYTVCVCGKDVTQKIHYCPYCGANIDGEKAELWREYTPRVW